MTDIARTRVALDRVFSEFEALTADLGDEEWQVQSYCPDWTVHGVANHLLSIESILTGWFPESAETPIPFDKVAEAGAELSKLSGPELAARGRELLAGRRAEVAALTDDQMAQPSPTPVGPGTYGRFMDVRVFDFWVHQRDMAMPLGRSTDDTGPAAEISLDEVHNSMGYIAGKKIGVPDGSSLAVHLTGPLERDIFVAVDGRAGLVDAADVPSPTVELTANSTSFIMLACGRIDPQDEIDAGRISWTGDAELGEKAARSLRFTM